MRKNKLKLQGLHKKSNKWLDLEYYSIKQAHLFNSTLNNKGEREYMFKEIVLKTK